MKKVLNTIGWILASIGLIVIANGYFFGLPLLVISYFLSPDFI